MATRINVFSDLPMVVLKMALKMFDASSTICTVGKKGHRSNSAQPVMVLQPNPAQECDGHMTERRRAMDRYLLLRGEINV